VLGDLWSQKRRVHSFGDVFVCIFTVFELLVHLFETYKAEPEDSHFVDGDGSTDYDTLVLFRRCYWTYCSIFLNVQ